MYRLLYEDGTESGVFNTLSSALRYASEHNEGNALVLYLGTDEVFGTAMALLQERWS